jgi:DNA polymerase-3 subunit epsilon
VEHQEELLREYEGGMIFAAFDLETTGLDPEKDEIAEIGGLRFDRRGILGRFSVLVNPGIPMPPGAGKVNNITDAMLRDAPPLEEVLPDFISFIRGAVLIAHNTPFDCGFINAKLERLSRDPPGPDTPGLEPRGWRPPFRRLPNPLVDTLTLARELFPGRASYKLQALAADFRLSGKEAHRAEDDAMVCMRFFLYCLETLRASPRS